VPKKRGASTTAAPPHAYDAPAAEREQMAVLETVVSSVTDYAIFLLDPNGNVQTWNEGAQRIKGYTRDEIVGQHFSRFYPAESVQAGWPAEELRRAVETGRFEDEGWRLRKDGSRFWANVVITARKDESSRAFSRSRAISPNGAATRKSCVKAKSASGSSWRASTTTRSSCSIPPAT
jgi:PAS domain S-box-containing protein